MAATTVTLTHGNGKGKIVQTAVQASFSTAHLAVHRPVEQLYAKAQWVVSHAATGYSVARFGLRRDAVAAALQLEEAGGELWGFSTFKDPTRLLLYTRLRDSGVLEPGVLVGRCGS